ncbi:MAG: hypothetical protein M3O02_11295 [Acidobacteriota bacterium]|nr:hypothetical protein [Acidobacteriota bacterium]
MPSWTDYYAGIDREALWSALFAHFQASLTGFATMGRRHIQPPHLPQDSQPAFFLVQVREKRGGTMRGTPNRLTLHGFIILYTPAPVTDEVPGTEQQLAATTLNGFFKQIDDALKPDSRDTGKFTLGGLVTECAIEGEVDQDPGLFTSQAAAILPIYMLVP